MISVTLPELFLTNPLQENNTFCKNLQNLLNYHESAGLAVDGWFGPLTSNAVKHFQTITNISVDGIVGPITWNKLIGYF